MQRSASCKKSGWDSSLQVAEVNLPAGAPPLSFHGYRRGRELGQGGSSQVFVCSRPLSLCGWPKGLCIEKETCLSPFRTAAFWLRQSWKPSWVCCKSCESSAATNEPRRGEGVEKAMSRGLSSADSGVFIQKDPRNTEKWTMLLVLPKKQHW